MSVTVRINSAGSFSDDSGLYVGMFCAANGRGAPGFVAAIGWEDDGTTRFAKLQDMTSGTVMDRIPIDWLDGSFHTYGLTYDETFRTLRMSVDSGVSP